jgi:hypothetical protein
MQTFLPLADFAKSARCLDRQRLGKQRVEVKQILKALSPGYTGGWKKHPAVLMWTNHAGALASYGVAVCQEWRARGYRDSLLPEFEQVAEDGPLPGWFGDDALHASHRSNLLRKLPGHYSQFGWAEPDDLPYVWPLKPKGNCFETAAQELVRLSKENGKSRYRLAHGEITGQGPIEGVKLSHAWVVDTETDCCIDKSNGNDICVPRVFYEAIARLDGNKKEYCFTEACQKLALTGHYGPWDLVTSTGL